MHRKNRNNIYKGRLVDMKQRIDNASCAILAGGENRRMPVLKAFIEIGGQRLIERTLSVVRPLFSELFVVTNRPDLFSCFGTTMLGDVYDERGPMNGIITALLNSRSEWVFVVACDMPFINKNLISIMSERRKRCDAVIPKSVQGSEPLFAFYSKRLLPAMENSFLSGVTGLRVFLHNSGKRVQYIPSREICSVDPGFRSFMNLNSPDDLIMQLKGQDITNFKKMLKRRKSCSA